MWAGHAQCHLLQVQLIRRKCVRLAVIFQLESMLQSAKKAVSLTQARMFATRKQILSVQAVQREQRTPVLDRSVASAMQPLQALHKKLDIADAPTGQLHIQLVMPEALPRKLLPDTLA